MIRNIKKKTPFEQSLYFHLLLILTSMNFSDRRMRFYLMDLARKKGVNIDVEKLESNTTEMSQQPYAQQNCSIIVPDVGIIL